MQSHNDSIHTQDGASVAWTGSGFVTAVSPTPLHSSEEEKESPLWKTGRQSSGLASVDHSAHAASTTARRNETEGRVEDVHAADLPHDGDVSTSRQSQLPRMPNPPPQPPSHCACCVLSSLALSDNSIIHRSHDIHLTPVATSHVGTTATPVLGSWSDGHHPATPYSGRPLARHTSLTRQTPHTEGARLTHADKHAYPSGSATVHTVHSLSSMRSYGATDETAPSPLSTLPTPDLRTSNRVKEGDASHEPRVQHRVVYVAPELESSVSLVSDDEFGDEDWAMDHPLRPINFGGLLVKPFNPRAEYLFTVLQVIMGTISSFVHGAVAGANATTAFIILYDAFTNDELSISDLTSTWSVLPAMLGMAIGMYALGSSLMKTVGVELVTVTPSRGWCIQFGGTLVTMVLTGVGIPVSLSQAQVGAAIGCGILDARSRGVSWGIVTKIITGWVITLIVSATTTALAMIVLGFFVC